MLRGRIVLAVAVMASVVGVPADPGTAGPLDPPPTITSVGVAYPWGDERARPEIHVDWGAHIDAPQGIVQGLGSSVTSDPQNLSSVVDYTSIVDSGPESYRAGACYENCGSFPPGETAVIVWGEWFRPDVSDYLDDPPPSVVAGWDADLGIVVSAPPSAHPEAPAFAFYRNGEFLRLSARTLSDYPTDHTTVVYAARACYSDCTPVTVESGFAQMTPIGPGFEITQAEPPVETSIVLECSPETVLQHETTSCYAFARNEEFFRSQPTGLIEFSVDGQGTLSPSSCDYSTEVCSFDLTPEGDAGDRTVTASYRGSETHLSSVATAVIIVRRPTATTLVCTPSELAIGETTSCTASLRTSDDNAPVQGALSIEALVPGDLSLESCQLDADGTCRFTFTPAAGSAGFGTLWVIFDGVDPYGWSSGSFSLSISERRTNTTVECAPAAMPVGGATMCAGHVTDWDGGTGAVPTGELTIEVTSLSKSETCSLDSQGSCEVTFAAEPGMVGSYTARATYHGSAHHAGSTGSTSFTITKADSTLVAEPALAHVSGLSPTLTLSASLRSAVTNQPIADAIILFRVQGEVVCTAWTDGDGRARCSEPQALLSVVVAQGYEATFEGDQDFLRSTAHGALI